MDAETLRALREAAGEIARLQRRLDAVERGTRRPQLGNSSIDSGALEVRDPETGATRARIGWLPDGSVGLVTEGGDPVSAPTVPVVTPSLGGLRVTWDGALDGELALPGDFDHMAVHVSTASGFTPSAATYVGSIRRAGDGGMLPVVPLPYQAHYVVLVPVTTGGVTGTPSAEASATPLRVDAPDLTAGSVQAAHIAAGAITADKLEALLVLATTILAGIPGGARVELDQDGLRGYNTANELVFAIDSAGNAVFSGDVTGSLITGSRMVIGDQATTYGLIEQTEADAVHALVQAQQGARTQLRASSTRAEVGSYADAADPAAPVAGLVAQTGSAGWSASSDQTDPGSPVASGIATPTAAYLAVRAERDNPSSARLGLQAQGGLSILEIAGPPPASGPPETGGALYGFRSNDDIHSVSLQSPVADGAVTGGTRRSLIHVEGAGAARQHAQVTHFAKTHLLQGESLNGAISTEDGTVTVAATHSILSARHAPVKGEMLSYPSPLQTSTTVWYDFPATDFAPITFRTSWSGRTRITIMMCGLNAASPASSIALGFRLSGGSTVPASLRRCAFIRSIGEGVGSSRQSSATVHLQLAGAADYTLTPVYRVTSGTVAYFDLALDNSITVEPLT